MTYIHPTDPRIHTFISEQCEDCQDLEAICRRILDWFNDCVEYSRLQAPFYPLQRSDLDLLDMHSGTCGDYSNLVVSVLLAMGFEALYAYVHKDCYGDPQDHICAAVKAADRFILIDATQPYRKWFGFDCPHREYELLTPVVFEQRMKKEEDLWRTIAKDRNRESVSGLLYAPWIHAQPVLETDAVHDKLFYLLSLSPALIPTLYVYYQHYTAQNRGMPVMAVITPSSTLYHFSIHPCRDLWDDAQWSQGFKEANLPSAFCENELRVLKASVLSVIDRINVILDQAQCCRLTFPS